MTRTTGRSAFLSLLKDEGITHLFGNPGTTELPVMHALMDHPELTYVMAMQESLVVAMADGFSRASGKLVACNVYGYGYPYGYASYAYYGGGCYFVPRRAWTPWGWRIRQVEVCD
jgi:glyoxylate carboligase